ncbi:MAG: Gfo/Idh/MocA family oxidoreductase, partial [Methanoregula sp.]
MHIGVIGVGAMGMNHARIYSEMKSVDSVSLFDSNRAATENVAKMNNAFACDTLAELESCVDAVSLCVPTKYHFDIAKNLIDHNIPILIEKPICQTVDEAQKLVNIIPENAIVGVGHIERFNPVVKEIAKILKKPLYVEIKRHNPASARVVDGSVVEDLMIHDIDIIFNLLFTGQPTLYSAGNQDVCTALFNFDETPVYLSASRKSSKKIRMIYVEEENYTIEADLMTQEISIYRKPDQYSMENCRYVQDNVIEKVLINKSESLKD